MKRILFFLFMMASCSALFAQKVDSIYFNLYTDSLKKGQHNYINIDGKMSNGIWMPLTSKDINFSCAEASFVGNELVIPEDFKEKKVTVIAVLKSNPAVRIERTIWVKIKPDGPLPTRDEIINAPSPKKTKKKD